MFVKINSLYVSFFLFKIVLLTYNFTNHKIERVNFFYLK